MKKIILLIIICHALVFAAAAQTTIGIPAIKNYTHTDYNASTEVWDVKQDRNGILYFANNDGLLTFDGSYWKIYPLPNKGTIKALAIDPDGKIFVGGQDEIGYFFPDANGILKYHSIKHLMPQKARQFADIWSIVLFKNEVFFRTIECVFEYNNNEIKTFDAPGGWRLLSKAGSQLFAEDKDEGLMFFKDYQWQPCRTQLQTASLHITGVMDYNRDTVLLTTLKQGLFLFTGSTLIKKPTAIDPILQNDLVNCAKKIGDDRYAIGTKARGLIIIDGKGNVVERFSNNEGLQNNNVLGLLLDRDKNLWLGLESGIDFINYNTSVKRIYANKDNQLKSNAVSVFNNKLFIGTSNGLYNVPLDARQNDISNNKGVFTEVENTKGQVWSLREINHNLLVGHEDGALVVDYNRVKQITNREGAWRFLPIPSSHDIIAGTYTGLQLIKNNGNDFTAGAKMEALYESLPTLAKDNDDHVIWASHSYRGVYKIQLSADRRKIIRYTQYTDRNGLPSVMNNHVYFLRGKVLVATEKGVYEYNNRQNKFAPSAFYKPALGNTYIEHLTADSTGNIWFISNQRVGVIDFSKPSSSQPYTVIYFPELAGQTVKGAGYIYPYDKENIFIGSNNGVFHLNYRQYVQSETKLNVLLTTVKAIAEKDSLIFGGYFMKDNDVAGVQGKKQIVTLSNHWNSFHFEYSSTLFAQKSNEEFSYKLEGFDSEWSKWSVKTEKDYTNLPYGRYTFSVRVRNNLGNASTPVSYTFVVDPAWYQTTWAYLFYLLLVVFAIYLAMKEQRKRFDLHQQKHEEEQRRLSYLHSLELDRNEKEIMALKNNNLESELNYKNKELATITMHLVERGRILLNIREELVAAIKKVNMPDLTHEFRNVFKLVTDTEKKDDDWNHFAIYFDQVHNNFLSIMKTRFPGLSPTDLKLCAYLRLNLTSKEIAQLMNISLKGVEISRYRVRKKLGLATEVNLYDFLIDITK
ncbi:Y_Y_Y domain-containing protein [Mucilaginibacter lappiensis]|uniref:Ligand-binding sensor domain-containing protein/DNA-binding CsgD family transcriptional regulator n=1 Tax=Mucilaginibacter lappiensis TaxID=354630 RepID=A0ABR6PLE3_9SPHI|nr:two-component regulator propeller domain-containing protein [Mucilaginibacter lappiensis]MBB6110589.1 ligand-binding sensor domain-containing protein/DNA-binding CsgD family transcriptional regulator [Mucilaginibacter lappiensis]SIR42361.1 Y_Y_Y domain-containing protein [Mucilaginibacter lappiensis]